MAPSRRAGPASGNDTAKAGHGSGGKSPVVDLEAERRERMARNAAALAALGVVNAATELRKATAASKAPGARPAAAKALGVRKQQVRGSQPLRRSGRLAGMVAPKMVELDDDGKPMFDDTDVEDKNRSMLNLMGGEFLALAAPNADGQDPEQRAAANEAQRVSNSRGLHDQRLGISCHFCRQKTLCCEANCKRCRFHNSAEECSGKSRCSRCESDKGVFCRSCLLVRYGQNLEDLGSTWLCPHCYVEEHGDWKKHGWFCNSSFCMRKMGNAPTGILIHKAREKGYASVAHMLQAAVLHRAKMEAQAQPEENAKVDENEVQAAKAASVATEPADDRDDDGQDVPLLHRRSKRVRAGKAADKATAASGKAVAEPRHKRLASPPAAAEAAAVEL